MLLILRVRIFSAKSGRPIQSFGMRGDGGWSHLENYISTFTGRGCAPQTESISINWHQSASLNLEQFLWLFNDGMSETPNDLGENLKKCLPWTISGTSSHSELLQS